MPTLNTAPRRLPTEGHTQTRPQRQRSPGPNPRRLPQRLGLAAPPGHPIRKPPHGRPQEAEKGAHPRPGDHVFGDLSGRWGGFAEYVCAPSVAPHGMRGKT